MLHGDDEVFLRFLAEILHPVVRSDSTEAERICQLFNQFLRNDGFQLVERTRLSGKPVFVGRYVGVSATPGLASARESLAGTDPTYVAQQITRIEAAIVNDPSLAIGTAKELVETCCKTILADRGIAFSKSADVPELMELTAKELELTPDDIPEKAKARGDSQAPSEQSRNDHAGSGGASKPLRHWPRKGGGRKSASTSPCKACCGRSIDARGVSRGDAQ